MLCDQALDKLSEKLNSRLLVQEEHCLQDITLGNLLNRNSLTQLNFFYFDLESVNYDSRGTLLSKGGTVCPNLAAGAKKS